MPQYISTFSEIADEFVTRAHTSVWCNAATVDEKGRPRSRVLHPIWEGQVGWIAVNRHSPKAKHLEGTPYLSLAYISDPLKPVYAECRATWENDIATKERVWDLYKSAEEPLGYDPGMIWQSPQNPEFGLLRLEPWLIRLYDLLAQENHQIWRAD